MAAGEMGDVAMLLGRWLGSVSGRTPDFSVHAASGFRVRHLPRLASTNEAAHRAQHRAVDQVQAT